MEPEGKPQTAKTLPTEGDLVDGKYRIQRVLGEGGMGRVFEAHHEVLDQKVAIKLLFAEVAERPNVVERFLREAKAAAKLRSDHVARVMDAGTAEGGLPFIVMECLDGADLLEFIKVNGPMSVMDVADVGLQALEAIGHAHAAGFVHRDLKPSNLFLASAPDGTQIVKVLDFGIAKSFASEGDEIETLTGQSIMGSPAYMSPEQIRNAKTVDPRSDLWSLGVVLYELLTGSLPFRGDGVGELLAAVLEQAPIPLRVRREDIPEDVEQAIHQALRRNRDRRYANAGEFARALAPFASARWSPLADRIEALLANATATGATGMGRSSLPPSTGRTMGSGSVAISPAVITRGEEITTIEFPLEVRASTARVSLRTARARKRRTTLMVGGLLATFTVLGAGVAIMTQRARLWPRSEAQTTLPLEASVAARLAPIASSPHDPQPNGITGGTSDPPPHTASNAAPSTGATASLGVGESAAVPPTPGAKASASHTPASRPGDKASRPKVLHSRE